jgi:RNA polymerase sigma-70 factor (ECF subfamily)
MTADDREVMSAYVANSDPHHLATLYARHHLPLLRFLQRLTRQRATAEDLAQQTWVKLMDAAVRRLYSPGEATFRSYLYRLAHNAFVDECTRKHVHTRRQSLNDAEFDEAVTRCGEQHCPEAALQGSQSRSRLRAALGELPDEQREVLRWWSAGDSIAAMAKSARAPRDTVLSRKKYALARLRRSLEGDAAFAF